MEDEDTIDVFQQQTGGTASRGTVPTPDHCPDICYWMVTMQPHQSQKRQQKPESLTGSPFLMCLERTTDHHAGMKVLCSVLPLGEMRARFWVLFMFSFLLPPTLKYFFPKTWSWVWTQPATWLWPPELWLLLDWFALVKERACGPFTQWACLWDVETGERDRIAPICCRYRILKHWNTISLSFVKHGKVKGKRPLEGVLKYCDPTSPDMHPFYLASGNGYVGRVGKVGPTLFPCYNVEESNCHVSFGNWMWLRLFSSTWFQCIIMVSV